MSTRLHFLLSNKFIQGSIIFTGANFLVGFLNYLFNSISAKALGPEPYGEIVSLFAYLTILSVPTMIISTDIIKRLGEQGKFRQQAFAGWQVWAVEKVKKWRWIVIPYIMIGFTLPGLLNISQISAITLLIAFPGSFVISSYVAAFHGFQLFHLAAVLTASPMILKLTGAALVYFGIGGLTTLLAFIVLSIIFTILYANYLMKGITKSIRPSSISDKRIIHILLNRNTQITIFSLLGIYFLNNFDVIFVKKFFVAQEAGIYGGWSLFAKIIFYVFGAINILTLVFFSSREHAHHQLRALWGTLLIIASAGGAAIIIYSLFGLELTELVLSAKFGEIITYLPYAAAAGTFYTIIFVINNYFIAKNSRFSLIGLGAMVIYAVSLFIFGRSLEEIYLLNVILTGSAASVYLCAIIFYNRSR